MNTWLATLILGVALTPWGCSGRGDAGDGSTLSGAVAVDGSSTVLPVTEAIAEEFQIENPGVRVTVGVSGTGGGFSRFCAGETDVSNASRPISEEERAACATAGIEPIELPVAWDGLSVVVNPANEFVQCLTVEELGRIWRPGSTVATWRDVRPEFPAQPIKLYGPGTDSGTFDYFTEVIVGETGASRPDYQASEDDNVLVQGVVGDRDALGYFGYAYVQENADRLKVVAIDGGSGCVAPNEQTISDKSYAPMSRPLLIYVKRSSLARPEAAAFVRYYMTNAPQLVPATGYVPLGADQYQENLQSLGRGPADVEPATSGAASSDAAGPAEL